MELCKTCGRKAKYCIRKSDPHREIEHEPACGYHRGRWVSPAYWRHVSAGPIAECADHPERSA